VDAVECYHHYCVNCRERVGKTGRAKTLDSDWSTGCEGRVDWDQESGDDGKYKEIHARALRERLYGRITAIQRWKTAGNPVRQVGRHPRPRNLTWGNCISRYRIRIGAFMQSVRLLCKMNPIFRNEPTVMEGFVATAVTR
jgi:hypothetical protein